MKMATFEDRVRKVIIDSLQLSGVDSDQSKYRSDARLMEDLGADSLDCVNIIMDVEQEFSIDITDKQAEKMKTPGDIVAFLTECIR